MCPPFSSNEQELPKEITDMKRILLFVLTNLAVVVVLGIVANLLGVNRFLTANF